MTAKKSTNAGKNVWGKIFLAGQNIHIPLYIYQNVTYNFLTPRSPCSLSETWPRSSWFRVSISLSANVSDYNIFLYIWYQSICWRVQRGEMRGVILPTISAIPFSPTVGVTPKILSATLNSQKKRRKKIAKIAWKPKNRFGAKKFFARGILSATPIWKSSARAWTIVLYPPQSLTKESREKWNMYDLHLKAGLGSLEETAWFSMKEVFNTNFF